jgi:hypothetical protein
VTEVSCIPCGRSIDEPPDARRPCPNCGSLNRAFEVAISSSIMIESHVGTRLRSSAPGRKGWARQLDSGDSFYRDSSEWHQLERSIDRVADRYDEVIKDSVGNVVREVHEPLSQHRNRGSAKPRSNSRAEDAEC